MVGLELNAGKTKYVFVSRRHNTGKYHNIGTGMPNESFEKVKQFTYL
jgi:hypothetical protein